MTKEQAHRLYEAIKNYVVAMRTSAPFNDSTALGYAEYELRDICLAAADSDDPKPECPAKRVEYYVCYSDGTPEDFAKDVNKMLAVGWRPQGGISVGLRLIYQALVREVVG